MSEQTTPNEARQRQAELVVVRREELSQTVTELAQRFDVKARARDAVAELRSSARQQLSAERLLLGAVVVGSGIACFSAVRYWRCRPPG
jgi:nicotinate-nucleotide pyrophosphorylase